MTVHTVDTYPVAIGKILSAAANTTGESSSTSSGGTARSVAPS